ncbi:MAG: hypothetical protein NTNFB02_01760 [Nitrospira sp.]
MLMDSANLLAFLLGLMRGNKSSSSADIYSETVYRDLVHREFKRSERAGQLCQILLVYRTNVQGLIVPLGSELAGKAISLLSMSVRDTDYIGWYRHGRIIGVLLTTVRTGSARDGRDSLKTRLEDSLHGGLTLMNGHSLQIHALEQD